MTNITVGTKNQVVIPKEVRSRIAGFQPGRKVKVYSQGSNTVVIKVEDQSWLQSGYGLMKRAWRKIDPENELEESREQW